MKIVDDFTNNVSIVEIGEKIVLIILAGASLFTGIPLYEMLPVF